MPRLKCIRHKLFANNVDIIQSAIRNRFELLAACNKMMVNVRTQSCVKYLNDKLTVLGKLFGKQCNAIAAQRVRRANQIMLLYNDLYGDKYYRLFRSLGDILKKTKKHPLSLMLGAALFSWDEEKVTDNDLQK